MCLFVQQLLSVTTLAKVITTISNGKKCHQLCSSGSKAAATSKMERFVMESLHNKVGGLFEKGLQTAVSGLNYSRNLATIILFGVTLSHMVIGSIPNSTNVIS